VAAQQLGGHVFLRTAADDFVPAASAALQTRWLAQSLPQYGEKYMPAELQAHDGMLRAGQRRLALLSGVARRPGLPCAAWRRRPPRAAPRPAALRASDSSCAVVNWACTAARSSRAICSASTLSLAAWPACGPS